MSADLTMSSAGLIRTTTIRGGGTAASSSTTTTTVVTEPERSATDCISGRVSLPADRARTRMLRCSKSVRNRLMPTAFTLDGYAPIRATPKDVRVLDPAAGPPARNAPRAADRSNQGCWTDNSTARRGKNSLEIIHVSFPRLEAHRIGQSATSIVRQFRFVTLDLTTAIAFLARPLKVRLQAIILTVKNDE